MPGEANYVLPSPIDPEQPLAAFYDGESCTYIAHSVADAHALYLDSCGFKNAADSDVKPGDWSPLRLDKQLGIHFDDGRGGVTKTVAEWIASEGRGFLCSEDF